MANRIATKEEIKMIWNYYKSVEPDYNSKVVAQMIKESRFASRDFKTFNYMIDLFGYNAFPSVKKDFEYTWLETPTYYRGVEDPKHNAQTLADFDYHRGIGVRGCGLYASKELQETYRIYANDDPHSVLEFKLDDNTRIVSCFKLSDIISSLNETDDFDKIDVPKGNCEAIYQFIKELDPEERQYFTAMLDVDPSKLAILLGYDAVKIDFRNCNHIIVLNRGKMVVRESEYKRITDSSKIYKNGFVDFENKSEEDFLQE